MASWEFKLPDIGEGVTEGEIVAWLVKPGDVVTEDQPMVEVMTDKATVTITAPKAGVVVETRGKVGEIVPVHAVLVVFELDGPRAAPGGARGRAGERHRTATTVGRAGGRAGGHGGRRASRDAAGHGGGRVLQRQAAGDAGDAQARAGHERRPAARAAERAGGARDEGRRRGRSGPPRRRRGRRRAERAEPAAGVAAPAHASRRARDAREERVPFAGMRRRIAQKMAQSKSTAAHFTFVEECDVTALKDAARAAEGRRRGAGREAQLPAVHREGRRRGAQEAPDAQHDARRDDATRSSSASTTTSASRPRPTRGSSCRS